MTSSIITKKKIAKSFKILLLNKPFDKISIVDIMEQAQIRRQTFYNHFVDKYQLLDWIFENELQEHITDNANFISGRQLLKEMFFYFERQKKFYRQLFKIKGQNDFSSYFIHYCEIIVTKIYSEYTKFPFQSNEQFYTFHIPYHAHALAEYVKQFVNTQQPIPNVNYFISEITQQNMRN